MSEFILHKSCLFRGSIQKAPYSKVLITGLGRSGTSAIATLLYHLGYYLGDVSDSSTKEDRELRENLKNNNYEAIIDTLNDRSLMHELIAFKDPKIYSPSHQKLLASLSDEWLIVSVSRDPVAIAQRRVISEKISFEKALSETVDSQMKLMKFMLDVKKSSIIISYEKFMSYPTQSTNELSKYIKIDSTKLPEILSKVFMDQNKYRADASKK